MAEFSCSFNENHFMLNHKRQYHNNEVQLESRIMTMLCYHYIPLVYSIPVTSYKAYQRFLVSFVISHNRNQIINISIAVIRML